MKLFQSISFSKVVANFVLLSIILACNKQEIREIDYMYDYYPLKTGSSITYEVDSITYDDFFEPVKIDTASYLIKEEVGEVFIDNSGRTNYEIKVYRSDSAQSWQLEKINLAILVDNRLEKVEDNLRFIKLIFPPKIGSIWAGNGYINFEDDWNCGYLGDWQYRYITVGVTNSVNSQLFDETLEVLQVDEENVICKNFSKEIYAKNIGLVYRYHLRLTTQVVNPAVPFIKKAEKGYIIEQKIKNYSN